LDNNYYYYYLRLLFILDCLYDGISSISLSEASLHFAHKRDANSWRYENSDRIDCNGETFKWSATRLNFTYTLQNECDKVLFFQ
jgi:hypothetical protein